MKSKHMVKAVRLTSLITLVATGISALAGGYVFITDPSGSTMHMPLEFLNGSPFNDFLIPGLVLFTFIGVSSLVLAYLVANRYRHYPLLLIFQGIILWIWLLVQIATIKTLDMLQMVYAIIGLVLVLCGIASRKHLQASRPKPNR